MAKTFFDRPAAKWRNRLHEIIFEADTRAGRFFDVALIWFIIISVTAVMLESVAGIREDYGKLLISIEWLFTILFTLEYLLRLISLKTPARYAVSFFGMVDLLAILPTYLSLLFPGGQYFLTIRLLRLLRIFRVLKLTEYLSEAHIIMTALSASRKKISVFLMAIVLLSVIMGALIYVIEGEGNGFTSIPTSIYWAIVTLTTVGYGDLSPQTALGKMMASIIMIMGYAIIAVPTGIVTAEFSRMKKSSISTQACPDCGAEAHDSDAHFCKYCGSGL